MTKAPLSYGCSWCSDDPDKPTEVRVSLSNLTSNLQTHRDGSTAAGRSKTGCPGRLRDRAAGLIVPPSVAERENAKANDKNNKGSLASFVTVGPKTKFDNLTFNQMLGLWMTSQALPWNRMNDKWLQSAVHYLRPEARMYGRKWAADEAKRLNLSIKKVVFDELQVSALSLSNNCDVIGLMSFIQPRDWAARLAFNKTYGPPKAIDMPSLVRQ